MGVVELQHPTAPQIDINPHHCQDSDEYYDITKSYFHKDAAPHDERGGLTNY